MNIRTGLCLLGAAALLTGCASPHLADARPDVSSVSKTAGLPSVPDWIFDQQSGRGVGCVSYRPDDNYARSVKAARIKALAMLAEKSSGSTIRGEESMTISDSNNKSSTAYNQQVTQSVEGYVKNVSMVRREVIAFPDGDKLCVVLEQR